MTLDTNKIQTLLINSVKSIQGIPHIVEPNTAYTPRIGTQYITTTFTMGEGVNRTVSGISQTWTGTIAFNCFHPANSGYNNTADLIIAHFQKSENMFLDYDTNFKLQIINAWKGSDLVDDKKTWSRNTAMVRYRITLPIG